MSEIETKVTTEDINRFRDNCEIGTIVKAPIRRLVKDGNAFHWVTEKVILLRKYPNVAEVFVNNTKMPFRTVPWKTLFFMNRRLTNA